MSRTGLERRVAAAAEEALAGRKFVTVADVCIGLGWLHSRHVDSWRHGRTCWASLNPAARARASISAGVKKLMNGVPEARAPFSAAWRPGRSPGS